MDPTDVYELIQLIGQGTFGSVWKAQHLNSDELVAIKVVPVEDDNNGSLEEEIEILKKCNHELIVEYLGTYWKDDAVWMVMEYCPAGSVADLMSYCNITLEEEEIRAVVASVCLGLEYLHDQKLIHRDIKAGNILLSSAGQAKLADFGVAAQLTTMHSKRDTMTGAPYWMAPEVLQEEKYDNKADIWSLGITILEMAQGRPPHHHIHPMRVVFVIPSKPEPVFDNPDAWSPNLNDFLSKCLRKTASERTSASELLSHPWISESPETMDQLSNDGKSERIADLVEKHLPDIEAARTDARKALSEGSTLPSSLHSTIRNTTKTTITAE